MLLLYVIMVTVMDTRWCVMPPPLPCLFTLSISFPYPYTT
jgi:hypothetical protein